MNEKSIQLGRLKEPLQFHKMYGFYDYEKYLEEFYPESQFLTPCEIFKPYYGFSMARKIIQHCKKNKLDKINIIEYGPGLGVLASTFFEYIKNEEPQFYEKINYSLVDISDVILNNAKKFIKQEHPQLVQKNQIKFENSNGIKHQLNSKEPHFILMFELLDNLPHDQIQFNLKTQKLQIGSINEQRDTIWNDQNEINDQLIIECFEIWKDLNLQLKNNRYQFITDLNESYKSLLIPYFIKNIKQKYYYNYKIDTVEVFLPTGFLQLLKNLTKNLKNVKFIVSDFSQLPNGNQLEQGLQKINHPIISKKGIESNESIDYKDFSKFPQGECDIFFGTDFDLINEMLNKYIDNKHIIQSPREFFQQHAKEDWARTKSHYNPMKDDFQNTKYLSFNDQLIQKKLKQLKMNYQLDFWYMLSIIGCLITGLCWGLLNYFQKQVSLQQESRLQKLKLFGLFCADKSSSIIYIASIQLLPLSLSSIIANGSSIISAFMADQGKRFINLNNTFGLGVVLTGLYLFLIQLIKKI